MLGDVTDMVRPDHRCGLTAERVTESATPAVVPGNCGRAMVRWRGSIGRRFTQPRFAARNPATVQGCADLAISASALRRCVEQRLPHTVLAVMNANMVRADRRRGRTVNRVTESDTRPLFQEELRPGK
ncbi:MAG: hypothetical protein J0H84_09650 [Rhizobiales bacterium]|nr:hypothetical protein [Hyphomicrobiales bacterium]